MAKIVDKNIISQVSDFLNKYKLETGKKIRINIFYALCLHINSIANHNPTTQRVTNDQIVMTIQNYPKEYAAASEFAGILKNTLDIDLDISEITILTMFLIESDKNEEKAKPVLLYIMHGNTTAQSLCQTTNSLTQCANAYHYDLSLNSNSEQAMEEIKHLILDIDQGAGVFVIYDMDSIKTMLDTISEEIDVKIRYMNIPVTLIGIDIARKCSMETDIDTIFHKANRNILNLYDNTTMNKHNNAIITLCHTGEGGALQLKDYIDRYSQLSMTTIPLSISNRNELAKKIKNIQKTYTIHAFVGTYDPKLFGIPFISIADVFSCTKDKLDKILQFQPDLSTGIDYELVYQYLNEQLKYTSVSKIKTILPDIVDELSQMYALDENTTLGIFMHLVCMIENTLSGEKKIKNPSAEKIITALDSDYRAVSKLMKKIEKKFKIIIDDNEIATIIMMAKKI